MFTTALLYALVFLAGAIAQMIFKVGVSESNVDAAEYNRIKALNVKLEDRNNNLLTKNVELFDSLTNVKEDLFLTKKSLERQQNFAVLGTPGYLFADGIAVLSNVSTRQYKEVKECPQITLYYRESDLPAVAEGETVEVESKDDDEVVVQTEMIQVNHQQQ